MHKFTATLIVHCSCRLVTHFLSFTPQDIGHFAAVWPLQYVQPEYFFLLPNRLWYVPPSQFGHKLSQIDFPNGGRVVNDSRDFMQYADEVIDIQQKRVDDFGEKLDEIGRKLNVRKIQQ